MAEIINSSFPQVTALTPDVLQAVYARLAAYELQKYPSLDTRPGSIHGDLSLNPDSFRIAAAEAGITSLLGDLDMNNIIQGQVNDCDFVDAYLANMGLVNRPNASSSGVVRLIFDQSTVDAYFQQSGNAPILVDRGMQFLFGQTNVFTVRPSSDVDAVSLYPAGTTTAQPGSYALALLDQSTYAVDLPVTGTLTDTVTAGSTAAIDSTVPGLTQVLALYEFVPGNPQTTLAERAQLALATFYASSLNTRQGATGFVLRNFPEISSVSPVLTGDQEMIRDSTNILGFADGRVDVYSKASSGLLQDTLIVRVPFVTDNSKNRFIGAISFPDIPVLIDNIAPTDALTVPIFDPAASPPVPFLISSSADPSKGVLGGITRSQFEVFTLAVDMPVDGSNNPLIPVRADGQGQYGLFTITYRFDPGVRAVGSSVSDSSVQPAGVDVLSRAPVPVVFSSLNIRYLRTPGTSINAGSAQTEILQYVNSALYPKQFSLGPISDSMVFYGASQVRDFVAAATVRQSPATYYLQVGFSPPQTNAQLDALISGSGLVEVPVDVLSDYVLSTLGGTSYPVVGLSVGQEVIGLTQTLAPSVRDGSRYMAYGPRNLCWVLDPEDLHLVEVRA